MLDTHRNSLKANQTREQTKVSKQLFNIWVSPVFNCSGEM